MIILPSLEIVPAKFNGNILLSQIPVNGAGDFTVSRALNTATRVNSLGNIEAVNADTPRIDYLTSSGTVGCPALLVEPSGSNLALRSQEFDDAYWTADDVTVSGNAATAPDNTTTADIFTASGTTGEHDCNRLITVTSGTTYTLSCFFKKGTTQYAYIGSATSLWQFTAILDLDTGLVTSVTAGATANVALINGFYRLSLSATATGTGSARFRFGLTASPTSNSSTLTTTDTIVAWGAQLETGSVATSYIPTTTAAVTRNADVVVVSGAVSGSIGQTEGTIYAEVDVRNWVNNSRIFSISDGTQTNRIMTLFNSSNRFRVIVDAVSGSAQVDISSSSLTNGVHKIAVGYAANDVVFYVNGVLVGSDTTVNIPACSQAFLGKIETSASSNFLNDRIRAAALYTTRLTNTQLALLTSPYTSYSSMASALSYTLG